MNPWQMARTLFNPKVHESLHINQNQGLPDGRQEHSVIDVLIPMGPDFVKLSKFRSAGPMFQQKMVGKDPLEYLGPKYARLTEDPTVREEEQSLALNCSAWKILWFCL